MKYFFNITLFIFIFLAFFSLVKAEETEKFKLIQIDNLKIEKIDKGSLRGQVQISTPLSDLDQKNYYLGYALW